MSSIICPNCKKINFDTEKKEDGWHCKSCGKVLPSDMQPFFEPCNVSLNDARKAGWTDDTILRVFKHL